MSHLSRSTSTPSAVRIEPAVKPGKSSSITAMGSSGSAPKATKTTAIRRVVEDAAKMNLQATEDTSTSSAAVIAGSSSSNSHSHGDDYEGGKVLKASAKKAQLEEDVRMVQDLDRWG